MTTTNQLLQDDVAELIRRADLATQRLERGGDNDLSTQRLMSRVAREARVWIARRRFEIENGHHEPLVHGGMTEAALCAEALRGAQERMFRAVRPDLRPG